jgi:ketosteroid isomerase-like protein
LEFGVDMPTKEEADVAQMDIEYQAAVEKNDAVTMDRILADGFVLVVGSGKVYTKADLLEEARSGRIVYERQDAAERTVRLWGGAAIVTALLSAKGTEGEVPFAYRVWFSDTYIRTPAGWRYVHGQSGTRLPGPP